MQRWFIFFVFLAMLAFSPLVAQPLEFEVRLMDTLSTYQFSPDLALLSPDILFATWTDLFMAERRIFCAKSDDGGISFGPGIEPDPSGTKMFSCVDVDTAGNPYLAWTDIRTGFSDIRFARSLNGGGSYEPSVVLTNDWISDFKPEIKVSADGQLVFVAWSAYYDTTFPYDSVKVMLARSTDGGASFQPAQHIGGNATRQQHDFSFDVSANGDTVVFVWEDLETGTPRVLYSASFDAGVSFCVAANVDPDPAEHGDPSVALLADTAYIAYDDTRSGNLDIRMAKAQVSDAPAFLDTLVDGNPDDQDQPACFVDPDRTIYVSYRSSEYHPWRMIFLTMKRASGAIYKEWIGIYEAGNDRPVLTARDSLNVFCSWEYNPDTFRITVFARSVPVQAPGPPENLLANGGNPSPWDSLGFFRITFTRPYDPSGINHICYKLGAPPDSNTDTTATFPDTFPPDTISFVVYDTTEGGDPMHIWLMDCRGYMDYHNHASVLLRFDGTPPTQAALIEPDSNTTLGMRRPFFAWHPSSDSGGSGLATYVMCLDTTPAFDTTTRFYATGLETTITIPDTLWDDEYFWAAIPIDSAGNWQLSVQQWNFHIRATPPPLPVAPPDSAWVGTNFQLIWRRIPDPFAFTRKFFFEIATDSLFSNVVRRDSTPTPQDTVFAVNNWTIGDGYWHVRARNLYGVYTPWSQRMFFRQDTIPPPAPALLSPADGYITNNVRPAFSWHSVADSLSGLQRYILGIFGNPSLQDTVFIAMTTDTFATPSADLPDGDLYWIVLARDRAGNTSMPGDTFHLVIDITPPVVNTVIPGDGQVGVAVNTNVIVMFSESMDTATVGDSTFVVIDNLSYRYYGAFSFNAAMNQLTFDPTQDFYGGRNILVTIDQDVADIAGNGMGSDYSWQFVTEFVDDSLGPVVSDLLLAPDSLYIGDDIIITATVTDTAQGNSMVVAAEYFIDSVGADSTGMMLSAVDSFDSNIEDVIDTLGTATMPYSASHWIFVHGLDVEGNWGPLDSAQFWIIDTLPPQVSVDEPVQDQELILGRRFQVSVTANKAVVIDTCYLEDTHGNVMALQLELDSLLADSTAYGAFVPLQGIEPGMAELRVVARDIHGSTSGDSVRVNVTTEKSFLPEDEVYTWPNPADDEVHFRFFVNRNADITIEIFTIAGRRIATLKDFALGGDGRSEIRWQTTDVGSDLYLFRLTAQSLVGREEASVIGKFAIVK